VCDVTRSAGLSSRTQNMLPAHSTLDPAHQLDLAQGVHFRQSRAKSTSTQAASVSCVLHFWAGRDEAMIDANYLREWARRCDALGPVATGPQSERAGRAGLPSGRRSHSPRGQVGRCRCQCRPADQGRGLSAERLGEHRSCDRPRRQMELDRFLARLI
jgi:hypothetical protein